MNAILTALILLGVRAGAVEPLPTVGADFFAGKRYRLMLVYVAPAGTPADAPLLVRGPFLPGRVPDDEGGTTANWTCNDTLDLVPYTREAVAHFFREYSYGGLTVEVDVPLAETGGPVWVSAAGSGKDVTDDVLRRIEARYPGWFRLPEGYDYQRLGLVFVRKFPGLVGSPFARSSLDASLWTTETDIWDGSTFGISAWSGAENLWPDAHARSDVDNLIHETLHHLTYAHPRNKLLGDRGVYDYQTRTNGFDIMDHNGKPECNNGHYGTYPLSPLDQFFYGFIGAEHYQELTGNTRGVRIAPRDRRPRPGEISLCRVPLSEGTESFIISCHRGEGVDEAYNVGLDNTPVRGLQIWHIADDYRPDAMRRACDVEVAWTLHPDSLHRHPDGIRSWPVRDHLPPDCAENFDWIDCSIAPTRARAGTPFYPPPGSPSIHILNGAFGAFSAGEPGFSAPFCNYVEGRWVLEFDRETRFPTERDFFRPGQRFTPYTAPNTDHFHLTGVEGRSYRMHCGPPINDDVPVPRTGRIVPLITSSGPTRVAVVNPREVPGGDMLFDLYHNYWEGAFSHAKNFGADTSGRWDVERVAGMERTTYVVGEGGFQVDAGRELAIGDSVDVLCLGDVIAAGTVRIEGTVRVIGGGRFVVVGGGTLALRERARIELERRADGGPTLVVGSGGRLMGEGGGCMVLGEFVVESGGLSDGITQDVQSP